MVQRGVQVGSPSAEGMVQGLIEPTRGLRVLVPCRVIRGCPQLLNSQPTKAQAGLWQCLLGGVDSAPSGDMALRSFDR